MINTILIFIINFLSNILHIHKWHYRHNAMRECIEYDCNLSQKRIYRRFWFDGWKTVNF